MKIESPHNQTFKKLLGLTGAKGLKQDGLFLLSGEKLVREYLASRPSKPPVFEVTTDGLSPLTQGGTQILELARDLFARLDVLGTAFNIFALEQPPMALLDRADMETYAPRGIEVVIPVGDPGNLGALVRSCEAFGVGRVILTREAAHPFLPKAVKASAGSVLRVPMTRGPSLAAFPASCIALDAGGTSLYEFRWPDSGLLVVGEEGAGLGADGAKRRFRQMLRIPTQGVESLNVVVAASVALAHKARQT